MTSQEGIYRNRRDGFRFLRLTHEQAKLVTDREPSASIKERKAEPGQYVVSFWLREDGDYNWLPGTLAEFSLSENDYGFFISLVTASDSEIVSLPDHVADLYRKLGGQLDFSFTVV